MSVRVSSWVSRCGKWVPILIGKKASCWLRRRAARRRLGIPWRRLRRTAYDQFMKLMCLSACVIALDLPRSIGRRLRELAHQWLSELLCLRGMERRPSVPQQFRQLRFEPLGARVMLCHLYTTFDVFGPKVSHAVAKSVMRRSPTHRGCGPGGASVARLL